MAGRIQAAVGYSDAGQMVIGSGSGEVPFDLEGCLALCTLAIGQPERCGRVVPRPARARSRHACIHQGSPVIALTFAGSADEAMAAANGLIEAAEATRNPMRSRGAARLRHAVRDADPARALDALRRGLAIAQDSGNRDNESHLAAMSGSTGRTRGSSGRARILHPRDPQLPRFGQHHPILAELTPSLPFSTGSDAMNLRPPSPVSPANPSPRGAPQTSGSRSPI